MAQQILNPNSLTPDDKLGDTPNDYTTKINANFTELYGFNQVSNIVEIFQESDFPTQDATTITLESGTGYWIKKPFTTAKKAIGEGGAVFSVVTDIAFWTYTGTGAMFSSNQNRMRFDNLVVSCPSATVFEVTGDGTTSLASRVVVSAFVATECIGIFSGINGGVFAVSNSTFNCVTSGSAITHTGSVCGLFSIERMVQTGSLSGSIAINLGSTVFDEVEINNHIIAGDASTTAISGLTNSGNIAAGSGMSVANSNYSGLTTPLSGITESDIRMSFGPNNSTNLLVSRNAADLFLIGGTETITTGSSGDWQEIGTPSSGGVSWSSDISDRFTVGTDGVITYTGEREINVHITGRATVEKSGGGSDVIEVRIAKNWNGTASDSGLEKSRAQTQSGDPTTVSVGALISIVNGDDIRPIFSNVTGTSNIEALVSSLEVSG